MDILSKFHPPFNLNTYFPDTCIQISFMVFQSTIFQKAFPSKLSHISWSGHRVHPDLTDLTTVPNLMTCTDQEGRHYAISEPIPRMH
jgi:hypothetical protein